MKRLLAILFSIMILISIFGITACSNQQPAETSALTTAPTTAPTQPTTVNPYTQQETLQAAYEAYCAKEDNPYPIQNIVFSDENGCYIIPEDEKVYSFFSDAVTKENLLMKHGKIGLYFAPSIADLIVLAMQNAWNTYATTCAQNYQTVYSLQLYLFECDYFPGVFGIDEDYQLVQDLVLEGVHCGKFGPFTIYVPENADQVQDTTMTDGELMVILQNIYGQFATEQSHNLQEYEPIEYYIFERNGEYYRVTQTIEHPTESEIAELATEKAYNGWHIYLPVELPPVPYFDQINAIYQKFVVECEYNSTSYKSIEKYAYFDGTYYYTTDEWCNVFITDIGKIGKKASQTEFDGYLVYKLK